MLEVKVIFSVFKAQSFEQSIVASSIAPNGLRTGAVVRLKKLFAFLFQ